MTDEERKKYVFHFVIKSPIINAVVKYSKLLTTYNFCGIGFLVYIERYSQSTTGMVNIFWNLVS